MANTNKKNCISDNDCENNNICAFNEEDLNHYCINNDVNDLYYGCIDSDYSKNHNDSIESKSKVDHLNYKSCIDFSRRQINSDGLEYNYMVFKPKKNVYVDTTTINIYLKCEEEILAIIPYNDYFTIKCDESQENCVLQSKETLLNFIIQNSKNCKNKLYLEIIYECENEGLKKNEKIPIYIDNYKDLKINLTCPIDINNDKFKSKCESMYIDNYELNKKPIDINKSLYDCKNPLYKVPRIISNVNNYKRLKSKHSNLEIKDYDNKINEKLEDLKKLEAEKYIKLKKIQTGESISYEDAYSEIGKYSIDKLVNSSKDKWKIYNNYDAAQKLVDDNDNNNILKYHGVAYTIEEATKAANDNDANLFVWYHNSYELDNFASKLYFIDIYNAAGENEDLLNKTNWVKHENVSTGILKLQYEHFADDTDDTDNTHTQEKQIYEETIYGISEANKELKHKYMELIDKNLNTKDLNNNILKNLNDKITTYGQAISMNNYETNINNKILMALGAVLGVVVIIFVVVMVYFNNKTAGKIKLFGM